MNDDLVSPGKAEQGLDRLLDRIGGFLGARPEGLAQQGAQSAVNVVDLRWGGGRLLRQC
ncbi:MAG TPA: hypothetical protein VGM81_15150 [Burkholderiaceae bacterium]